MPTILLGSSGASSRTSGSAHRSPVSSIGPNGCRRWRRRSARRRCAGLPLHLPEVDLAGRGRETGDAHGRKATRPAAPSRPGRCAGGRRPYWSVTVRERKARQRAVLMLGALAAALLLAGGLPWVTGGDSTIRFLALPLLLAGLMVPARRCGCGRPVGGRRRRPRRSSGVATAASAVSTAAAPPRASRSRPPPGDGRRPGPPPRRPRRWAPVAYPVLPVLLTLVQVVAPQRAVRWR